VQLPQNGGCICGALCYEITRMPIAIYTCHCTNRQRLLGSAFSMSFIVADEAFHLSGCEPRPIQRTTNSGRTAPRWICPEWATIICSGSKPGLPSQIAFRRVGAGTLDDTSAYGRRLISGHAARSPRSRCLHRRTEVRDTASGYYGVLVIAAGGGPRRLNPHH
jgi:hypothetical protein